MIETTPGLLEATGIRVMKYSPDFPEGTMMEKDWQVMM